MIESGVKDRAQRFYELGVFCRDRVDPGKDMDTRGGARCGWRRQGTRISMLTPQKRKRNNGELGCH